MNPLARFAGWLSIPGALTLGCYSTSLIQPSEHQGESLSSGEIQYLVLKDGTMVSFDAPPKVVHDTVITLRSVEVPILLSDVAHNIVLDPPATGPAVRTHIIVTKDSTRHQFSTPPRLEGDSLMVGIQEKVVRIPASDISEASVKTRTVAGYVALAVVAAVGIASLILIVGVAAHGPITFQP